MLMEIPNYIDSANVVNEPITYKWGSKQEENVLLDQPRLKDRLDAITFRGVLAFSLGATEWVVWRLSRELKDETPFQLLQAAWAGMVDWRYVKTLRLPDWEPALPAPVGGPLGSVFRLLASVYVEARAGSP